jgi:hypothetical protein
LVFYNIKTFFKNYLFYINDFETKLESLKELARVLCSDDIKTYICGGFSIFLLVNKAYRKCKDIDLMIEHKDSQRLINILEKRKIPIEKKPQFGTFFFKWKDVIYDVHPFTIANGVININYMWQQNMRLKIPQADLAVKGCNNLHFGDSKLRIVDPTSTFVILGLSKDTAVKKLDFYYLKNYVSKDTLYRILQLNPRYSDLFDFQLLNYSLFRWVKDELNNIVTGVQD